MHTNAYEQRPYVHLVQVYGRMDNAVQVHAWQAVTAYDAISLKACIV